MAVRDTAVNNLFVLARHFPRDSQTEVILGHLVLIFGSLGLYKVSLKGNGLTQVIRAARSVQSILELNCQHRRVQVAFLFARNGGCSSSFLRNTTSIIQSHQDTFVAVFDVQKLDFAQIAISLSKPDFEVVRLALRLEFDIV